MMDEEIADAFAEKLWGAAQRVCRDYAADELIYEEPFTDQLCGRLKETLEGFETKGVRWQADVATSASYGHFKARSLSKGREEPAYGADIIMALDIDTPDYAVKKSFIAQAKRLEPGEFLSPAEHHRLVEQCERMLALTPSSMVFLYHNEGVHVLPAAAVISLRGHDLWSASTYDLLILFKDFAICWFGDPRIQAIDPLSLEGLREQIDTRSAIRLIGRPAEKKRRGRKIELG